MENANGAHKTDTNPCDSRENTMRNNHHEHKIKHLMALRKVINEFFMDQTKEDERCRSEKNRIQDNGSISPNPTILEETLKNLGLNPDQDHRIQDTNSYTKTPYEARHNHE